MNGRASFNWRRVALATLRLSVHGTGWLLIHVGRLMQCGGQHLSTIGAALNPARPALRRE